MDFLDFIPLYYKTYLSNIKKKLTPKHTNIYGRLNYQKWRRQVNRTSKKFTITPFFPLISVVMA